jgi:hypothetical protein
MLSTSSYLAGSPFDFQTILKVAGDSAVWASFRKKRCATEGFVAKHVCLAQVATATVPTVDLCVMPNENADRSCQTTAEGPGTFDVHGTRV